MLPGMGRWIAASALVGAVLLAGQAGAGGDSPSRTRLTVWSGAYGGYSAYNAYGGYGYGGAGVSASTSGLVTEQRDVDVPATGEVRFTGIASSVDPVSVQLRDITEPSATVNEQRFHPGATTPSQMLAQSIGETITIVTAKGELTGVLRAIDDTVLAIEMGTGDQRRLSVLQRSSISDVKLPSSATASPAFAWRLGVKKPGKHTLEVSYRADGLVWTADYLAVLDDGGKSLDFSAWATVRNTTGARFDNATLTLVDAGAAVPAQNPYARTPAKPPTPPTRFAIARPVSIGNGEAVQVELTPAKTGLKAKSVVVFESMPDASASFQSYPSADCSQFSGSQMGNGTATIAVEADLAQKTALPGGHVRLFRRNGEQLEVVNDETFQSTSGVARISIAAMPDVTGERSTIACNVDESSRTIDEKLEIKVTNKSAKATEVVVREYMWRWPVWKLQGEDSKSEKIAPQTLEYRLSIPAKGSRSVTYSVRYTW